MSGLSKSDVEANYGSFGLFVCLVFLNKKIKAPLKPSYYLFRPKK